MVSIKKRKKVARPSRPRIPSELIAVESLVKVGCIKFRCHWQIYDFGEPGKRSPGWQQLRSKIFKFSAGSMEELLAAVHGAVLTAHSVPGVRLEGSWRKWCPQCGQLMTVSSEHECRTLDEQRAQAAFARSKKGIGRKHLIKTLDKENVDDTINAETKTEREEESDR